MATVDQTEHAKIEAKVRKLIAKNLDQRGLNSNRLVALCKRIKELKEEHDYYVYSWVGRSVTILIKEGKARIAFDDTGVLKFFATK